MSQKPIYVTESFLPPLEDYTKKIGEIWESGHLTNHGPHVLKLEEDLQHRLGAGHLAVVSNGTLALQIAIKALDLAGEIITTPFSYVATVSSIVWEGATPVFVDISKTDFCIDVQKIENAITEKTSAILATHVYGHPCDVVEIERIATKHGLKVIYDAAHAFDIKINEKPITEFGDISTLSFHATKVFHMGEGGAVITPNADLAHRIKYLRNFGHNGEEEFWGLGINAKVSEIHAALGNCVYPYIDEIKNNRKQASVKYDSLLSDIDQLYKYNVPENVDFNYAYYPVLFDSEETLLRVKSALNEEMIFPRRYFYPSLNKLPYVTDQHVPVTDDISKRILCLPLSAQLTVDS
ncbi:MAG: dTDP-4-amino-4,6-dideoxygalactose transaminase, partial [Bacteroidia bacterium]